MCDKISMKSSINYSIQIHPIIWTSVFFLNYCTKINKYYMELYILYYHWNPWTQDTMWLYPLSASPARRPSKLEYSNMMKNKCIMGCKAGTSSHLEEQWNEMKWCLTRKVWLINPRRNTILLSANTPGAPSMLHAAHYLTPVFFGAK